MKSEQYNHLIHEIRNPLNCISMNAELGKLTLERTGDVEKARAIFDTILRECRRCSDHLSDLKTRLAEAEAED